MKKGLKRFLGIVTAIVAFFVVINVIPPTQVIADNPFIKEEGTLPMVAAHRGGAIQNPENTLKAFKYATNVLHCEVIESDVWMTKDNHLVFMHDSTVNRTSDIQLFLDAQDSRFDGVNVSSEGKVAIGDLTLAQLKLLNMGYNFKDSDNNYPYRDVVTITDPNREQILEDNDLCILEFDKLFEEFYDTKKDLLFIVEIKNGREKGFLAANIFDDVLTNQYPDYKNRLVVGTFNTEVEQDLTENHPTLIRGGSTGGVTSFVVTQMLGVNIFSNDTFQCLQIPMSRTVKGIKLDLTWDTYISRAHRKNMSVQYWTINDPDDMRFLIEKGTVDVIMTDDPVLLMQVYEEYK